jgi:signal transduction histidine kinase
MADPTVVAALAAAGGVVVGSAISTAGTAFRERLVSQREREAQEALRVQEKADQRAIFQRESILALQDAIADYWTAVVRDRDKKVAAQVTNGEWPATTLGDPIPDDFHTAYSRVNRFRARVFDDKLRDLSRRLQDEMGRTLFAANASAANELLEAAQDHATQMNERITSLLRELY